MEVIQFPSAKGLLNFDGMGIKIDVEKTARVLRRAIRGRSNKVRFCNLDSVEAGKVVRKLIEADILDETGSSWAESIEYLEAIVAIMKAALARLEASEDRAQASGRGTSA